MRRLSVLALSSTLLAAAPPAPGSSWPVLEPLYQDLHQHPELSCQEWTTAAKPPHDYDRSGSLGGRGARAVWRWTPRLRRPGAE